MAVDVPLPVFPAQFGRFVLLDRIAVGGMAEIFKAKMTGAAGFEKIIVIKRILPHLAADKQFVDMFIDEAKLTVHLVHPKIVQVLEFGEVDGQYYIALEYVNGLDCLALLRACAHKRMRLPLALAVYIGAEVLDALDYAHRATDPEGHTLGIVHRDISPSNVFISHRGDVKLGDFGIAHATERQSKTQAGTLKGKYGYMSPEQVVGAKLDGRSDIFAFGIVFAEMLMGRRLFTSPNDLDVLLMVRDVRLDRLHKYGADLPSELRDMLLRALRRAQGERWQQAGEFRDHLQDWLYQQGTRVGPSDLGAFLRSLYIEGTADSDAPQVKQATIAGQSTKAAIIQAELLRHEAARAATMPPVPAAPPAKQGRSSPPASIGAAPSGAAVGAHGVAVAASPSSKPSPPSPAPRRAGGASPAALAGAKPSSAPSKRPSDVSRRPAEVAKRPALPSVSESDADAAARWKVAPGSDVFELSFSDLEPVSGLGPTVAPKGADAARPRTAGASGSSGGVAGATFELELDGIEVDLDLGGSSAPGSPTPSKEFSDVTPASLAEAFQVLESTPTPFQEPTTAGKEDEPITQQRSDGKGGIGAAIDDDAPTPIPMIIEEHRPPTSPPPTRSARVEIEVAAPNEIGDLAEVSATRIFCRLAIARETGMLRVECGGAVKDIYLAAGIPEFVTSNLARELLGEYLVDHGVITSGELSMALAMMPRFGGKLGDTLVGLSLLRPIDVFRHLTRQVRDKLIDVFTWARGHWKYWSGRTNNREAFPLGLDAFEIIGAGVLAISMEYLSARFRQAAGRTPRSRPGLLVDPDVFRVGSMPRDLLSRLDGSKTVGQWAKMYTGEQELCMFYRTLFLLLETDLATLD